MVEGPSIFMILDQRGREGLTQRRAVQQIDHFDRPGRVDVATQRDGHSRGAQLTDEGAENFTH